MSRLKLSAAPFMADKCMFSDTMTGNETHVKKQQQKNPKKPDSTSKVKYIEISTTLWDQLNYTTVYEFHNFSMHSAVCYVSTC